MPRTERKQADMKRPSWPGRSSANVRTIIDEPVTKLRGCRLSAPIVQPWGASCRVVEWINIRGERSFIAVHVSATEPEIRERMRQHANGQRHVALDAAALGRPKLRRA
ncbi:conserved hypothetical protein [Burkholderia sp. 8Y]|uniref:DUF2866 domain-containing protein n=1 Tax=Burkholderia sp. 8Y TaxID=2653133 RepID=UPI0012EF8D9F|nr:DUF2866 domain-containing protein [Burkholderia sp. 8Y]VXC91279.1 conserved hypothetical protein [Burkholderia sp. 8Y]